MTEPVTPAANSPKLLDQVCDRIRLKHHSIRTETQYGNGMKARGLAGWLRFAPDPSAGR